MDHLPQVIDVALEGCRNIYTILDKVRNFGNIFAKSKNLSKSFQKAQNKFLKPNKRSKIATFVKNSRFYKIITNIY